LQPTRLSTAKTETRPGPPLQTEQPAQVFDLRQSVFLRRSRSVAQYLVCETPSLAPEAPVGACTAFCAPLYLQQFEISISARDGSH
jgi:hypothetical protein